MTFGYLAQPIDQARRGREGVRLRQLVSYAEGLAADAQVSLFRPGLAYKLPAGMQALDRATTSYIDTINRQALDMAEIVFAVLPLSVPTLGTPVEIERALGRGTPVVILTEWKLWETSVQIQSWHDAGALVFTLTELDSGSVQAARLVRAALRTEERVREALPVAPERPADLLPYVRADTLSYAPTKAYADDAGFDLAACEDATIPAGGSALVRTGLKFALPPGHWGLILGRSSTWAKRGLVCMPGVIDSGWRGELFVSLWNPGTEDAKVLVGERVGQYILLPAWAGHTAQVDELPPHARGENGFGSSGL